MLSIHSSSSHTTNFLSLFLLIMRPYHCALRLTRLADLVIAFRYDRSLALDHWASLQACPFSISILLADRTGFDFISARNILGWRITWVSVWRLDWLSTQLSARSSIWTLQFGSLLQLGLSQGVFTGSITRSPSLAADKYSHLKSLHHDFTHHGRSLAPLSVATNRGILFSSRHAIKSEIYAITRQNFISSHYISFTGSR